MAMPPKPNKKAPEVRVADLTGRERHLQIAVNALEQTASLFSKGTRRTLPFLTRQRAKVSVTPVIVGSRSGSEAEGPSMCTFLESGDGLGWAALRTDSRAINMILEGTLGAVESKEDADSPKMGIEMTAAQRALVSAMAKKLAVDYATALRRQTGWALRVGRTKTYRSGEKAEIPDDAILAEVNFEGIPNPSSLQLLIGAEGLEGAIQPDGDEFGTGDPRIAEGLREVSVPLTAELGRVTLALGRVLALQPGEALRLPTATDDPITVRVAGVAKFKAVPVISRGQVSVRIGERYER